MAQLNRKKYFQAVPAGAASYATIEKIEGNTVAWNQQVDNNHIHQVVTGTKNNNAITDYNIVGVKNHVYYVRCVGTITGNMMLRFQNPYVSYAGNSFAPNSFFTLNGASDSRYNLQVKQEDVTNIFDLNVIDLTTIFGAGNEPTTVADFEAWMAQNGLPSVADYNAGELLSVKMSGMQTEDSSQQTLDTITLDVTTITGINTATNVRETIFPQGMKQADRAGTVKDILDLLSDTATVNVGSRAYQSGDESDTDVLTDGTTTNYALNTPIEYTDLQDGNGNPLNPRYKVEQGGTEQVLPVNTSTPTTVAPTLTTTYKKNI